jgi:hypothetical protein
MFKVNKINTEVTSNFISGIMDKRHSILAKLEPEQFRELEKGIKNIY